MLSSTMETAIDTMHLVAPLGLIFVGRIVYILVCFFLKRKRYDTSSITVPEGANWLWGHELAIFQHAMGELWLDWFDRFGLIVRYKAALFHDDFLAVADPRALNHILSSNEMNYVKSPFLTPLLDRLLGRGLVNIEGQEHRHYRKQLNPAFRPEKIKSMVPYALDAASISVERLAETVQQHQGDCTLNLDEWIGNYMLDVVCKAAFDFDTDGGRCAEAVAIRKAWQEQSEVGLDMSSFYGQIVVRAFPYIGKLPLSYFEAQARIKGVFAHVAKDLLGDDENGPKAQREGSVLSELVQIPNYRGEEMTMSDIVDHITTFFIAGHETTAGTTKMICYELCKDAKIQDRLRKEILEYKGDPTYEDLLGSGALPYLDAVVKEGLRVHPGIGITDRRALHDDVLPLSKPIVSFSGEILDSIRIKAGQTLLIPLSSINCVEEVWKDGRVFRPERWLDQDNAVDKQATLRGGYSGLSTFLSGPRMCIGYRLAIIQSKVFLISLLRNFVLHDTGEVVEKRISGTMQVAVVGRTVDRARLPMRITPYQA